MNCTLEPNSKKGYKISILQEDPNQVIHVYTIEGSSRIDHTTDFYVFNDTTKYEAEVVAVNSILSIPGKIVGDASGTITGDMTFKATAAIINNEVREYQFKMIQITEGNANSGNYWWHSYSKPVYGFGLYDDANNSSFPGTDSIIDLICCGKNLDSAICYVKTSPVPTIISALGIVIKYSGGEHLLGPFMRDQFDAKGDIYNVLNQEDYSLFEKLYTLGETFTVICKIYS